MTMHDFSARFIVSPELIEPMRPAPIATRHFRNYAVTPEGHIIIKNWSADFRDRLTAVLGDDSIPYADWIKIG